MRDDQRQARAAIVIGVLLLALLSAPRGTSAQQPNRAGLVIDFGDGVVATRCVEFAEPAISGYDVLRRSGLRVVADETSGMGVKICDIADTSGCSASDCFCRCQGNSCAYWTYYHLDEGAWTYSPLGASASTVEHGDVEGWVWGPGNAQGGDLPPIVGFDEICGSANGAAGSGATATTPPSSTLPPSPVPSATPALLATEAPTPSHSSTPGTGAVAPESPSPSPAPPTTSSPAKSTATPSQAPAKTREPTPFPSPSADPQSAQTSAPEEAAEPGEQSSSPVSVGHIAFGVIAFGLLGWLVYMLRSRGTHA